MLGTAHTARLAALADCIARRDPAAALAQVEAAAHEGVDLGALTEQLLGYLRDCLACLVGCQGELLLHTESSDHPALVELGKKLGLETLLAMAQILDQTLSRLRQSTHVRTLVELALVRLCKLEDLDALPGLVAQLRDGAPAPGQAPKGQAAPPPRPAGDTPAPLPPPQKKTADDASVTSSAAASLPKDELPLDEATASAAWKQTLVEIGDMTAEFASKADRTAISGPNRLVVWFRKAYTQAREYCERPEKRQKLEQTLSRIAGRTMRIDFAMLEGGPQEAGGGAEAPAAKPINRRQRQQELQRHPLIRKASELFDTEIIGMLDAPRSENNGEGEG
jgi:DNA polymerase-3 subunit gamma/tau